MKSPRCRLSGRGLFVGMEQLTHASASKDPVALIFPSVNVKTGLTVQRLRMSNEQPIATQELDQKGLKGRSPTKARRATSNSFLVIDRLRGKEFEGPYFFVGEINKPFLATQNAGRPFPESDVPIGNDDSPAVEQFHLERKERPSLDKRTQRLIKFFFCHGLPFASGIACIEAVHPFYARPVGFNSRSSRASIS
jgi:hypothetical protein